MRANTVAEIFQRGVKLQQQNILITKIEKKNNNCGVN